MKERNKGRDKEKVVEHREESGKREGRMSAKTAQMCESNRERGKPDKE